MASCISRRAVSTSSGPAEFSIGPFYLATRGPPVCGRRLLGHASTGPADVRRRWYLSSTEPAPVTRWAAAGATAATAAHPPSPDSSLRSSFTARHRRQRYLAG